MNKTNRVGYKPKIMMHFVMPGATGGPNILFSRIQMDKILKQKYNFVRLNQNRVAGGRINFGLIFELKKDIQKEKPDIIHISGMQSAGFHCMIAAVLAGCKNRIITTHGFSGEAINIKPIKKFVFNNIIEPLTLLLATSVQGISKYNINKEMVTKYAKHKSCYIYNFPPEKNELVNSEKGIREEWDINEEEVVFTTVSRVVLDKGYKQLSEAIKRLREVKNIRFLIVGDGNYEEVFKSELIDEIKSKKVIMLGKREDVLNILKESDVFVLPTLHENLGNVFLEAAAMGIPSIGANVGGVPEVIVDGETGILIPAYDSKALSEAIVELYNNSNLRKSMGVKAYDRLKTNFNSSDISYKFDQLYSSVLDKE